MKQYTTPEQTATLIELGFAPIARIKEVRTVHSRVEVDHDCNFTIGELIEMLPEIHPSYHDPYCLDIGFDTINWIVGYSYNSGCVEVVSSCELIDALYDMIIMLKEEGVI